MNPKNKKAELEKAAKALEADKKERAEKAKTEFERICKELNVEFVPVVLFNQQTQIPVNQILAIPIGFAVNAK